MSISMVKYHKTFFPEPYLTRILSIPTYDALHQIQLELKSNALSVHSNLGGFTHVHLVILMTNTKYAILPPVPYVRPVHPVILQIPNNATCVTSYELKRLYDNNLQVFHKMCGVKQSLVQKIVTAADKQYILSVNNHTTGQFTGSIHHIFAYILSTNGKYHQVI